MLSPYKNKLLRMASNIVKFQRSSYECKANGISDVTIHLDFCVPKY